jgi:hypothetical protein
MRIRNEPDRVVLAFESSSLAMFQSSTGRWVAIVSQLGSLVFGAGVLLRWIGSWHPQPAWLASVTGLLVVAIALFLGLKMIQEYRGLTMEVDRRRKVITLSRPRPLGTARRQIPFSDIADVAVATCPPTWQTFWGDTTYQLQTQLISKAIVPLSHRQLDRQALDRAAETITHAIR